MIRENRRLFTILFKLSDAALEVLAMTLAYLLRFRVFSGNPGHVALSFYLRMMIVAVPVLYLIYDAFELHGFFRYKSIPSEVGKVLEANLAGGAFLFLMSFFLRVVDVSRLTILFFVILNALLTSAMRVCIRLTLRSLRRGRLHLTRLLIVGWNEISGEFYDRITSNLNYGFDVIGYLGDERCDLGGRPIACLGPISALEELLHAGKADEVIISLDYGDYRALGGVIETCDKEGIQSSLLPFYAQYLPPHPYIDDIDGLPLMNLHRIPLDNLFNRFVKRAFDLLASSVLAILLSPLLLVTAIGIRLSSPGPVIYRQERVGRGRKTFVMYKFRSMSTENNADATTWGTRDDRRRTRFGAFIRKFSIDELPQLFNVIKGDMSLVGPRPERPFFVEKFREEVPLYMLKHLVRPGITGWAQVNGWRGDTSIVERVKCDLYYIENWSFALDIRILFKTVTKAFVNRSENL